MEEPRHHEPAPVRYEETTHPHNPPNSVLDKPARRAVIWSYFVPIVALFVVIGLGLLYWVNRQPHRIPDPNVPIGTVGSSEGGFDPAPKPSSTTDEIERRGEDLAPLTSVGGLADADPRRTSGRRVDLKNVDVESAQANRFWVRDGSAKVEVIGPGGGPQVRVESRVDVSGVAEPDGSGHVRVRADRVELR